MSRGANSTLWLVAAMAAALGGCAAEPARLSTNPVVVESDFDALFDAVASTLRENRFVIYRQDPRLGEIHTQPLTGMQMWEFWRTDAVGWFNQIESSAHTIWRTVDARVYPVRDDAGNVVAGTFYLEVRARTERLSVPEAEITVAAEVPKALSDKTKLINALELEQQQIAAPQPVFLGRDNYLEDALIRQILRRIPLAVSSARPAVPAVAPASTTRPG